MQLMTRSKSSMKIEPAVTDKGVKDWINIFSRIILADVCEVPIILSSFVNVTGEVR